MHRLVLVRHAEAGPAVVDADRRLTARGERDAAALGTWLAGTGTVPDRIVVSSARRTRQTWELASAALDGAPPAVVDDRLYEATPEAVLGVVRGTAEDVTTLVVVGHNPSLGLLSRALDTSAAPPAGFPPGAAAVFELDAPFTAVEPGVQLLADLRLPGG